MIPIKLVLEAFGPFREPQTLLFSELGANRMFLITGKTGSGKTTLFDAISFALFGEPSGSLRKTENLKSDFSPEGAVCTAEFTFSVHGHVYTVRRTPRQSVLKKQGGDRMVSETASLLGDDGLSVTGPASVDEAVEELLGLNREQFKKIVLLPQGEFRSFLDADSKERQKIFRDIFSTQIYDRFTVFLTQKADELKARRETLKNVIRGALSTAANLDERLSNPDTENPEQAEHTLLTLQALMEEAKAEAQSLTKQKEALLLKLSALDIKHARSVNQKLTQLESLRADLLKSDALAPSISKTQTLLTRLSKGKPLCLYEETAQKADQSLILLTAQKEEAKQKLSACETAFQKSRQRLAAAQKGQETLEVLTEKQNRLTEIVGGFRQIAQADNERIEVQKNMEKKEAQDQKLLLLQTRSALLAAYKTEAEAFDKLDALKKSLQAAQKLAARYLEEKNSWLEAYEKFLNGQAGLLAQDLADGHPCPVCGSRSHPKRAELPLSTPTQGEVDAQKVQMELWQKKSADASVAAQGIWQQASLALEALGVMLPPVSDIAKAPSPLPLLLEERQNAVIKARGDLEQGEKNVRESVGSAILEDLKFSDDHYLTSKREKLAREIAALEGAKQNLTALLLKQRASIPKEYPDEQTAAQAQKRVREQADFVLKELSEANKEASRLAAERSQLIELLHALENNQTKAQEDKTQAQAHFESLFREIGYPDEQAYREDLMAAPREEALTKEVSDYKSKRDRCAAQIEQLAAEVEGLKPYPILEMEEQQRQLNEALKETEQKLVRIGAVLAQEESVGQVLEKNGKALAQIDREYGVTGRLARLAKGENGMNLSFERFVMSGFFDQIVQEANLRLQNLTDGRYSVARKPEREKGRRPSGLDLQVLDVNTGKLRDTNTLSGGEGFLISLALALAVADIITSYSGGARIQTMFIDEGFGSLDGESLEIAMDTLLSLRQADRLIGIISHVEALSHYIPAKLIVTSGKNGSHAEFVL